MNCDRTCPSFAWRDLHLSSVGSVFHFHFDKLTVKQMFRLIKLTHQPWWTQIQCIFQWICQSLSPRNRHLYSVFFFFLKITFQNILYIKQIYMVNSSQCANVYYHVNVKYVAHFIQNQPITVATIVLYLLLFSVNSLPGYGWCSCSTNYEIDIK